MPLTQVVVPVIAPNVLLAIFRCFHLPESTARLLRFVVPIKDGQLCWAAIALCASALYELAEPGCEPPHLATGAHGYAEAGLIIILMASSMIAAGGAVFPGEEPSSSAPWYVHYKALTASLVLTALAGAAYTIVHFS